MEDFLYYQKVLLLYGWSCHLLCCLSRHVAVAVAVAARGALRPPWATPLD